MKKFYNLHNFLFIIATVLITIYSILRGIKIIHFLLVLLIFIIAMIITSLHLKAKGKKINKLIRLLDQSNREIGRLKEELEKSKKSLKELRDKIKKL